MLHACNNYYYIYIYIYIYNFYIRLIFFLLQLYHYRVVIFCTASLFSSSINSCDLNRSRGIVNWVTNYLILSIIGKKHLRAVSKGTHSRQQELAVFPINQLSPNQNKQNTTPYCNVLDPDPKQHYTSTFSRPIFLLTKINEVGWGVG